MKRTKLDTYFGATGLVQVKRGLRRVPLEKWYLVASELGATGSASVKRRSVQGTSWNSMNQG